MDPLLTFLVFPIITLILNFILFKKFKIPKKTSNSNLLLGLELTIVAIFLFNFIYSYSFTMTKYVEYIYFVPIYILTTGISFSILGYLNKEQ